MLRFVAPSVTNNPKHHEDTMNNMNRDLAKQILTIAVDAQLSDALQTEGFAFGTIFMPATDVMDGDALTFWGCDVEGGTYRELKDKDSAAVTIDPVAYLEAYPLPLEVFSCPYVKVKSDAAETAGLTLIVTLSS